MFWNGRGIGITEALHGAAQDPVVLLFALLTQLGDVWFLSVLGAVLYVVAPFSRLEVDRRGGLFVLGLVLAYVALIGVLKGIFLLPRPPGAGDPPVVGWIPPVLEGVVADVTTGEGPGFPSGHALGTTMVWGGVALAVVEDDPSRSWVGVAAGVVVTVSLSRLVLGVHYLVDVVAGAGIGVVVLGVLYGVADRGTRPDRVLLVAAGVGAVGTIQGVTFQTVAVVGGAVGAWVVWRAVAGATPARPSNRRAVGAGLAALGLAGGLFVLLYAARPPPPVTALGAAVAAGTTVVAPLAGERLAGRTGDPSTD